MASSLSHPPMLLPLNHVKSHFKFSFPKTHFPVLHNKQIPIKFRSFSTFHAPNHVNHSQASSFPIFTAARASSDDFLETIEDKDRILAIEERPVKFLFWVLFWASVSVGIFAISGDAKAAVDSISASSFGLKVAKALRGSGWPDEAVVFALATLPVIELRGAIPVGYWLQLKPVLLTVLSILGLVPHILLLNVHFLR